MSDTEDDGGDDGFDKEAEREKLREKYERDKKRREATQHMSDLLLKGATMTNQHCEECGSPIFRYEGEAFCPTCAGTRGVEEGETAGGAGQGDGQPAGGVTAGEEAGGVSAGEEAGGVTAGEGADEGSGDSAPTDESEQAGSDARDVPPGSSTPDLSGDESSRPRRASRPGTADRPGDDDDAEPGDLETARSRLEDRGGVGSSPGGDATDRRPDSPRTRDSPVRSGEVPSMAQSRASLRRAIVSLSEQAAQSDDPGRAHDLLKGAREAAEALAALEGTTGE